MTEERLEALLWREIEGDLSTEEMRRLEEFMAGDVDARAMRDQLASLNRALSDLEQIEPPEELRGRIRESLSARRRRRTRPFAATVRDLLGSLSPARVRFAYLVAGIFVGVVLALVVSYELDPAGPVDREALYGATNVGNEPWLELALGDGDGVLRLRRDGRDIRAILSSGVPLELKVEPLEEVVLISVSTDTGTLLERRIDWREIPGS